MKELIAALSRQWGIRDRKALEKWMFARGVTCITDLMQFGTCYHDCMESALKDFWEFST